MPLQKAGRCPCSQGQSDKNRRTRRRQAYLRSPPSKNLQNKVTQAVPLEMRGSPISSLLWLPAAQWHGLTQEPQGVGMNHAPEPRPLDLLQRLFFKGDLLKLPRLAWNLPSSCLSFLGAEISGVSHHVGPSCLPPTLSRCMGARSRRQVS